jgi:hypothetical protein
MFALIKKAKNRSIPLSFGGAQSRRPITMRVRILRYMGYTLAVPVALAVVLSLINLHDRKLDPRAADAMLQAPTTVADQANAMFAMVGPGIPDGEDPQTFGSRYVEANNQRMLAHDEGKPYDPNALNAMDQQNKSVPWVGETKDLCGKDGKDRVDCLHDYVAHRSEIQKLARDNKLRLERYRALYHYPGYADRMLNRIATAYPDMQGPEHETILGQLAIAAADGNPDAAAQDLVTDTQFWRRVLAGAGTVITKSVAANHLASNYALASQIAARYKSRPSLAAILAPMTAALTPKEKDWQAAINGEFQQQAYLYAQVAKEPVHWSIRGWRNAFEGLTAKALLKPDDSSNRCFKYFDTLLALNTVPAYNLIDKTKALHRDYMKTVDIVRLDLGYNPFGKILLKSGAASPETIARTIARTHNLDGAMRLLHLQFEIYGGKVPLKDIGAFVVKASGTLYQPFDYAPMHWNAESRELSFQGIDPYGNDELARDMPIAVKL